MPKLVIYHNPNCSKSCKALEILQQLNIAVKVIEYLQTPPSMDEIKSLLQKLKLQPSQLIRTKEAIYHQLNLDAPDVDNNQLIEAMHQHPILIERPIVMFNNRVIIARPPEKIEELL